MQNAAVITELVIWNARILSGIGFGLNFALSFQNQKQEIEFALKVEYNDKTTVSLLNQITLTSRKSNYTKYKQQVWKTIEVILVV